MVSMPRVFNFFQTLNFFVILVHFEILSQYTVIDNPRWLIEGVHWVIYKAFREKFMI